MTRLGLIGGARVLKMPPKKTRNEWVQGDGGYSPFFFYSWVPLNWRIVCFSAVGLLWAGDVDDDDISNYDVVSNDDRVAGRFFLLVLDMNEDRRRGGGGVCLVFKGLFYFSVADCKGVRQRTKGKGQRTRERERLDCKKELNHVPGFQLAAQNW